MPETRDGSAAVGFVREGYLLWNRGDLDGLSRMFSDDIEWQNPAQWPGQRVYRGREQVKRFLREEVIDVIELGEVDIEDIEVFGDELLLRLWARTRGQGSRLDIGKVPVFHVARVEGGSVARVRAFLDEATAVEAARGGR